jgi:hypothetical protein
VGRPKPQSFACAGADTSAIRASVRNSHFMRHLNHPRAGKGHVTSRAPHASRRLSQPARGSGRPTFNKAARLVADSLRRDPEALAISAVVRLPPAARRSRSRTRECRQHVRLPELAQIVVLRAPKPPVPATRQSSTSSGWDRLREDNYDRSGTPLERLPVQSRHPLRAAGADHGHVCRCAPRQGGVGRDADPSVPAQNPLQAQPQELRPADERDRDRFRRLFSSLRRMAGG